MLSGLLRLLVLPLRAPMLTLLVVIATYEGMQWTRPLLMESLGDILVVTLCTMPDRLLESLNRMIGRSQVVGLIFSLLLLTVGWMFLLYLKVLPNVLILGCAVLLARLDLLRLRMAPGPLPLTMALSLVVLTAAGFGHWLVR